MQGLPGLVVAPRAFESQPQAEDGWKMKRVELQGAFQPGDGLLPVASRREIGAESARQLDRRRGGRAIAAEYFAGPLQVSLSQQNLRQPPSQRRLGGVRLERAFQQFRGLRAAIISELTFRQCQEAGEVLIVDSHKLLEFGDL